MIASTKDVIGLLSGNEINYLKNSEIAIMDLTSTGSVITKQKIDKVFILKELKVIIDKNAETILPKDEQATEMTIDDFLDDFKL